MSADWLAAGPRGRKNPEPGQQISLFVFSSSLSSLCLLQLFSDSLLLLPLILRPTLLLVELVLLLSLLFLFARSLLEALLVYEFSFFIFRLLVVSANSLFPGCLKLAPFFLLRRPKYRGRLPSFKSLRQPIVRGAMFIL